MIDIKENESLSKYTTFHLGGVAKYFVVVKTEEELREALDFAVKNNLRYFILGGGSNLLFGDEGFDGLVIKIFFMEIEIGEDWVSAGAGVPLLLLIKKTAEAGLAGLEGFAGIPGTVGGAVCGNAGAYGKSVADFLEKAEILIPSPVIPAKAGIQTFETEVVGREWFEYQYRGSKLKYWDKSEPRPIILKAWFKLAKGEPEAIGARIQEILSGRTQKEPKGFCAGCAFKNIKGAQVEELLKKDIFSPDEKNLFALRRAIPAAWFIDRAELKGKKINGAFVPAEHANYVMNDGTAKAGDIIAMLSYIKQQVRDKFGVQLEEEIEIII
ncbi:MAG: UDP-N-acetylmuramate dehydrogenase [bacterium]